MALLAKVILLVVLVVVVVGRDALTDPFTEYTLRNKMGMKVSIIPLGGTITRFIVPDKDNILRDILLGFDNPKDYRDYPIHPYFGAIVGRYANRIANGTFQLNGFTYHTPLNEDDRDTLHGGDIGYDRRVWSVYDYSTTSLVLNLFDEDLVEAFPGQLNITVTYTINDNNEFSIHYLATTDSVTIINLSSHSYWNLNGFANNEETMVDHLLHIDSSLYTPVDSNLIPFGTIEPVSSAPWLDFRVAKAIGKDIAKGTVTPDGGYDNNLILDKPSLDYPSITVRAPLTGITMQVRTNQPGVQFYSSNFLDGTIPRKLDQVFSSPNNYTGYYQKYSGFVLETQHFPDSINHPQFPSTILTKGELFDYTTIFKVYVS